MASTRTSRVQPFYAAAVATEPAARAVLRLAVTGRLGQMNLKAALSALQDGVALLERRTHRLLGDRAVNASWLLVGLREESAGLLIAAEGISEADSRFVAADYVRSLRAPETLLTEDVDVWTG